jgi:ubiquinone/menaquinone biosynthesis C-methylase UbiE
MNLWNLKAHIYSLRNSRIISWILEAEKKNLYTLVSKVNKVRGMTLDIGTGTGHTIDILPESSNIICLDQSLTMLHKLGKKGRNRTFCNADALNLPFKNESFFLISSVGVSEYFSDHIAYFTEISRVLKKGGYWLTTISPSNIWNVLRQGWGNSLHTATSTEIDEITQKLQLKKIDELHSLMQNQYLFKK